MTYGMVGDGRVARHLSHYFTMRGLPLVSWSRSAPDPSPDRAMEGCNVVLVLINDDAIEPFIAAHPFLTRKVTIHCSGGLAISGAHGMHPLCTFGPHLYEAAVYERISFVTDADGPSFDEVFPTLPNPHYPIPVSSKPLYHALAVLAGHTTTVVWRKLFRAYQEEFGIPKEAVLPYVTQVMQSVEHTDDPPTGPIVRGDRRTMEANLKALAGDPMEEVYRVMQRVQAEASGS